MSGGWTFGIGTTSVDFKIGRKYHYSVIEALKSEDTILYDTIEEFNVGSKAECGQLNLAD